MRDKEEKLLKAISKGAKLFLLLICILLIPAQTQAAGINKKSLTLLEEKTFTLKVTGTNKKVEWKIKN